MIGGMLVVNRDDLAERLGFIQNASGRCRAYGLLALASAAPRRCRFAWHGTMPAAGRSRSGSRNGRTSARSTIIPDRRPIRSSSLAKRQMKGFGGMISFDVKDPARARRVAEAVKIFALAESLGGVESPSGTRHR
jgi:hypothetical protein